jgi:hypothetical protein
MDAPVWDASTFCKNRDRVLDGDVAQRLLTAVIAQPRIKALMSHEHFSANGTLAGTEPFSLGSEDSSDNTYECSAQPNGQESDDPFAVCYISRPNEGDHDDRPDSWPALLDCPPNSSAVAWLVKAAYHVSTARASDHRAAM